MREGATAPKAKVAAKDAADDQAGVVGEILAKFAGQEQELLRKDKANTCTASA